MFQFHKRNILQSIKRLPNPCPVPDGSQILVSFDIMLNNIRINGCTLRVKDGSFQVYPPLARFGEKLNHYKEVVVFNPALEQLIRQKIMLKLRRQIV